MAIEATILGGAVGGLVATIVMTIVMMGLQRAMGGSSPLPTAALWAQYVGDGDPGDYMMQGMVLHLLYGVVAGIVFVAATSPLYLGLLTFDTLAMAVVWGIVYAVVLFVVGTVLWMMIVLGIQPDRGAAVGFLINHLVYGIVLGAWVASGPLGL